MQSMTTLTQDELENTELLITKSVPWASREYTLKREPENVKSKIFVKDGIPRECAEQTKSLKGEERINAFNLCIAEKSKKS